MDKQYSANKIKRIMAKHGVGFSKSLGQHFLTDYTVIEEIIEGAGISEDDYVIEIGPGIGVLTIAAAASAGNVTAIEIDKKLIPILKETISEYENVEIIEADILKVDVTELCKKQSKPVKIIGNLPYYITTPIVMKLLEDRVPCESITIMMQKEVADRLMATPGTKAYGAITVAVQYYCTITPISDVPKYSFVPVPKVDSKVIRMDVRKERPVTLKSEEIFFQTIKAGFGQRRKTLLNSLTGLRGYSKIQILEILTEAKIDPICRAETLSIEKFALIANLIWALEQ